MTRITRRNPPSSEARSVLPVGHHYLYVPVDFDTIELHSQNWWTLFAHTNQEKNRKRIEKTTVEAMLKNFPEYARYSFDCEWILVDVRALPPPRTHVEIESEEE